MPRKALVISVVTMGLLALGCRPQESGLGAAQRHVDFEIVVPCWVPNEVNQRPAVSLLSPDRPGVVTVTYTSPNSKKHSPELWLIEERITADASALAGGVRRIGDSDVVIQAVPGGGTLLDWRRNGVHFSLSSVFDEAVTARVAESMILGCAADQRSPQ